MLCIVIEARSSLMYPVIWCSIHGMLPVTGSATFNGICLSCMQQTQALENDLPIFTNHPGMPTCYVAETIHNLALLW